MTTSRETMIFPPCGKKEHWKTGVLKRAAVLRLPEPDFSHGSLQQQKEPQS
jgi:hypothetical protein